MADDRQADVIVIGAGLAGLVAATELTDAGRRVILLDQQGPPDLGGQAWWSFGGLFLVDSPEQRRLRIRDSVELAWQDWLGTAGFEPGDTWQRRWAEAYVQFAAGEKRAWLHGLGVRFFPVVGWAERGGHGASGPGNSVPRFHVTWGTGPGLLAPFVARARRAEADGRLQLRFRHRVDELVCTGRVVTGVSGTRLPPARGPRGSPSSIEKEVRTADRPFTLSASAVVIASGGIGGDHDLVRSAWPQRLGRPPGRMLSGVPSHVDGRMIQIARSVGADVVGADRMWHYVEGVRHWRPVWPDHGVRILPGPSSLWLDATGRRLPAPLYPGFDTLGTLAHLRQRGHDHSWFVLTRRIAEKEFTLSGSDLNPDLTGRSWRGVLSRARGGIPAPVQAFIDHGEDFVTASTTAELVARMNALVGEGGPRLDAEVVAGEVIARDNEMGNRFSKDPQLTALRGARAYAGDRLIRVAAPHRLLDADAGPLIAVRLSVLTRKTLGGLPTDLEGRVLGATGRPVEGLYAVGECAGFGGGGMHGFRSLEGTFLGGCLFSGRTVGRALAQGKR